MTLISRAYWSTLSDPHPSPPDDRVWGVAYRIEPARVDEVRAYLDIREINGHTIHYTPFHPATTSTSAATADDGAAGQQHKPIKTLVYIGTPDNEQFVGPQDPAELAAHICRSAGPSGPNVDYLWGLERSLDELSPGRSGDEHVRDLAERARRIVQDEEEDDGGVKGREERDVRAEERAKHHEFRRRGSVDEVEETEKV